MKITGLLGLSLLLTGGLPTVRNADPSSLFFNDASYDRSAYFYSAPDNQGDDDRYVAYGYLDQFYEMNKISDGSMTPHQYSGDDTTVTSDYTYVYNRHEFCAELTNAYLIWQAKFNGLVQFLGGFKNSYSYADHDESTRDGVKISVYHRVNKTSDFQLIESNTFTDDFDVYFKKDTPIRVVPDECFFFEFDPNGSVAWDTVEFFFGTTFTKDDPSQTISPVTKEDIGFHAPVNWRNEYITKQGDFNRFYCYGSPKKYNLMSYRKAGYIDFEHWHGVESDQYIFNEYMNPGNYTGSMITWVSESQGVISIDGYLKPIYDQTYQTDGFVASIYLNEEVIFSYDFANYKQIVVIPDSLKSIAVKAGDHISYHVSCGRFFNSAWDGISFRTEIKYVEKDSKTLSKSQILKTLTLSDYSEIRGVTHVDITPEAEFTLPETSSNNTLLIVIIIASTTVVVVALMAVALFLTRKKKHE